MKPLAKSGGSLTDMEAAFAALYASTCDKRYSAREAGYAYPIQTADKLLRMEKILKEIGRLQEVRMRSEVIPLAVDRLSRILRDDSAPRGAQVSAIKVALDYGAQITGGALSEKDPSEMTAEEIAEAIAKFEQAAASRAQDVTPVQPALDDDIFA